MESGAGNKFNLEEGDVLSVRQCLYAMLLQSSNQSANALAEYVAGSRQAFVDIDVYKRQDIATLLMWCIYLLNAMFMFVKWFRESGEHVNEV